MPSIDALNTIQKLYIAYYQRPADPGGLAYWANRLDQAGGNLSGIIDAFATSAEANRLYGAVNSNTIGNVVDAIYQALFNRAPDPGGRKFYIDGFLSGRFTPGNIALDVLNGAQGADRVAINNKVTVANRFTEAVAGVPLTDANFGSATPVANYSGDADAQAARNWLKGVSAASSTVKTPEEVLAFVRDTIADPGDPVKLLFLAESRSHKVSGIDRDTLLSKESLIVQALDSGYHWDKTTVTYSYNSSIPPEYQGVRVDSTISGDLTTGWQPVSQPVRDAITKVIGEINQLTQLSIDFTSGTGDIRFNMVPTNSKAAAFAYMPGTSAIAGDAFI
ncbi:DUF4214 domain-containing protein, partial [Hydrogenophilus islandicus]